MILIFDTETTSKDVKYGIPQLVEIAWQIFDSYGKLIEEASFIIKPEGFLIPEDATAIHGITNDMANEYGKDKYLVLSLFFKALSKSQIVVGHNIDYDIQIMQHHLSNKDAFANKRLICTMRSSNNITNKTHVRLSELYFTLFNEYPVESHRAIKDVETTANCFWELCLKCLIDLPDNVELIENKTIESFIRTYERDFLCASINKRNLIKQEELWSFEMYNVDIREVNTKYGAFKVVLIKDAKSYIAKYRRVFILHKGYEVNDYSMDDSSEVYIISYFVINEEMVMGKKIYKDEFVILAVIV